MKKAITFSIALILVLGLAMVPGFSGIGSAGLAQADAAAENGVEASFTNLPLYFIENQGQLDQRVAYYLQGSDMNLYFTAQGVTFAMSTASEEDGSQEQYAIKLDFVGADPDVQPMGNDRTEAVINYFKGSPEDWKTGLPTYASVIYPDLWPGIDLVYSGDNSHLKYTFLVQPGADPGQIRLAYDGASSVTLNEGGQLEVSAPPDGFIDDRPVAYQDVGGKQVPVESSFALDEDTYSYGFELGSYDPGKLLVIDPAVLVYCGYIGGSGDDYSRGIAVDGDGCAYVTGYTWSGNTTFPVIVGPDLSHNGNIDAFVAKVKADGTGLVYCGYIGGSSDDRGYGIAMDGSGCAYVAGYTNSGNTTFPVIVGPDLSYNGNTDAFVAKVKADGSGLDYCGYISGSSEEIGRGIAVDGDGCAYVTGHTYSNETTEGFPVTVGPDLSYNNGGDAFVAKVKADPSDPTPVNNYDYCGYIGGSDFDSGSGIGVDGDGCAYITGYTQSDETTDGFPVAVGPDLSQNGDYDAFVAKVKANPSDPTPENNFDYCGYIGGSDPDYGEDIAVDGDGCAYVIGDTASDETTEGFPVAVGPDLSQNGDYDAFVAKVKANPNSITPENNYHYCGYIGGSDIDYGRGIAVDGSGCAYVTGDTQSDETTFPVTVGTDLSQNGNYDAFVARVKANPSDPTPEDNFDYCGYIGGSGDDYGFGIAVDGSGCAYITGYTYSDEATFPDGDGFGTVTGPDLTHNGESDAYVAKVCYNEPATAPVGGLVEHVDRLQVLAPWLGLAAFIVLSLSVLVITQRMRAT